MFKKKIDTVDFGNFTCRRDMVAGIYKLSAEELNIEGDMKSVIILTNDKIWQTDYEQEEAVKLWLGE